MSDTAIYCSGRENLESGENHHLLLRSSTSLPFILAIES